MPTFPTWPGKFSGSFFLFLGSDPILDVSARRWNVMMKCVSLHRARGVGGGVLRWGGVLRGGAVNSALLTPGVSSILGVRRNKVDGGHT